MTRLFVEQPLAAPGSAKNISVENNSRCTSKNNTSVENKSGGTLENERLVLYGQESLTNCDKPWGRLHPYIFHRFSQCCCYDELSSSHAF